MDADGCGSLVELKNCWKSVGSRAEIINVELSSFRTDHSACIRHFASEQLKTKGMFRTRRRRTKGERDAVKCCAGRFQGRHTLM